MSGYAEVDPILSEWAQATGSHLITYEEGSPDRLLIIWGEPPYEIFDVRVAMPKNGRTSVTATLRDYHPYRPKRAEDQTWNGSVQDLQRMLEAAFAKIEGWKRANQ